MINKKKAKPEVLSFKKTRPAISKKHAGAIVTDALARVTNPVIKETPASPKLNGTFTRTFYMHRAKDLGIKNFRVLNKAELQMVVKKSEDMLATDPEAHIMADAIIQKIVNGAVARWKAGWTKNKETTK